MIKDALKLLREAGYHVKFHYRRKNQEIRTFVFRFYIKKEDLEVPNSPHLEWRLDFNHNRNFESMVMRDGEGNAISVVSEDLADKIILIDLCIILSRFTELHYQPAVKDDSYQKTLIGSFDEIVKKELLFKKAASE